MVSVVLCLLLFTGLAGCIKEQDKSDTLGQHTAPPPTLMPGDEQVIDGMRLKVGHPVLLPDRHASEPSIAIADDGTIAVAAPAGSSFSPALHLHGGYVWVSTDGGKSFELKLDPQPPVDAPTAAACSCDADVTAIGNELFASTMYWTVNPFFNANIVSSTDEGQTWQLRDPVAAEKQPIDRQWISPGPDDELLLTYTWTVGREYLLEGKNAIIQQKSTDGGETWGEPTTVVEVNDHLTESYISMKPRSIAPSTILVPIIYRNSYADLNVGVQLAVSHDGGESFTVKTIDEPHDYRAYFHYSIDALPDGRVVAAWAKTSNETGTETLYMRQSHDAGDTWGPIQAVGLPGSIVQPWVAWRDDGVLAIAYYGSDQSAPILEMNDTTPWSPRVALFTSLGANIYPEMIINLVEEPTFYGRPCNGRPCSKPEDSTYTVMKEFLSAGWGNNMLHVAFIDARNVEDVGEIPTAPLLRGEVFVNGINVTIDNK